MSNIGVEELAEILEHDSQWIQEHYDEIAAKYPGERIAVHNDKIVAVGDYEIKLYCQDQKKKKAVGPLILSIPHPDNVGPFMI